MHSADGLPAAGEHGALEGQEPRAAHLYGAAAGTVKAMLADNYKQRLMDCMNIAFKGAQ